MYSQLEFWQRCVDLFIYLFLILARPLIPVVSQNSKQPN